MKIIKMTMKEDSELEAILTDYEDLITEYKLPRLEYLQLEAYIEAKKNKEIYVPKRWQHIKWPERDNPLY